MDEVIKTCRRRTERAVELHPQIRSRSTSSYRVLPCSTGVLNVCLSKHLANSPIAAVKQFGLLSFSSVSFKVSPPPHSLLSHWATSGHVEGMHSLCQRRQFRCVFTSVSGKARLPMSRWMEAEIGHTRRTWRQRSLEHRRVTGKEWHSPDYSVALSYLSNLSKMNGGGEQGKREEGKCKGNQRNGGRKRPK